MPEVNKIGKLPYEANAGVSFIHNKDLYYSCGITDLETRDFDKRLFKTNIDRPKNWELVIDEVPWSAADVAIPNFLGYDLVVITANLSKMYTISDLSDPNLIDAIFPLIDFEIADNLNPIIVDYYRDDNKVSLAISSNEGITVVMLEDVSDPNKGFANIKTKVTKFDNSGSLCGFFGLNSLVDNFDAQSLPEELKDITTSIDDYYILFRRNLDMFDSNIKLKINIGLSLLEEVKDSVIGSAIRKFDIAVKLISTMHKVYDNIVILHLPNPIISSEINNHIELETDETIGFFKFKEDTIVPYEIKFVTGFPFFSIPVADYSNSSTPPSKLFLGGVRYNENGEGRLVNDIWEITI